MIIPRFLKVVSIFGRCMHLENNLCVSKGFILFPTWHLYGNGGSDSLNEINIKETHFNFCV
jgi:hypothetical protein